MSLEQQRSKILYNMKKIKEVLVKKMIKLDMNLLF